MLKMVYDIVMKLVIDYFGGLMLDGLNVLVGMFMFFEKGGGFI